MLRRVLTTAAILTFVVGPNWSLPPGADEKHAHPADDTASSALGYDPKNLAFVNSRDSSDLTLIDTTTDTVVRRIPLGEYSNSHMAMVSHDGKKILVSATGRNRFLVVDIATGKIEKTVVTGHSPEHFDMSPDGRLAFVGNIQDSTVSVIDLHEGRELRRVSGFYEPHGFSVLPDGSKVYVSSLGAHEVAVLDPTGLMRKRLAVGNVGRFAARDPQRYLSEIKGVVHPTLTKDGNFAYAASSDSGELVIIDTRTDRVLKTMKIGDQPWRPYLSPDGRWMLVPNNGDSTVAVVSVESQKIAAKLNAGTEMTGVNYALDGSKAYVISRGDSTVYVYDMKTFGLLTRLKIGVNLALETAATSADGKKVFLASSTNDSVYVIDATTDRVSRIADVGHFPWGVHIYGSASGNYCH